MAQGQHESISQAQSKQLENLDIMVMGKWASFCVQLIGYFPLSSKKLETGSEVSTHTFRFTWKSVLPYFSCIVGIASFIWCFMYFWRYHEFQNFLEVKAPTEVGAFNLMIMTSTLSGIYMKVFALINGKKYQEFWEKTSTLFEHFRPSSNRHLENDVSTREFIKIGNSCWFECILMIIPTIIHLAYFYCWGIVRRFLNDIQFSTSSWANTDAQLFMGLGFWSLTALLHVGNAIWMNFFVKIYTACLNSISRDLKDLEKRRRYHHGIKSNFNIDFEVRAILDKLILIDHEIARFNRFFGNQLLMQVSNCVINLLAFSFFGCLSLGRGRWLSCMRTVVPIFLHGKELLDQGSAAERLTAASDEVLNSIAEDVALDQLSEELHLKIQILSVQLCTKPPVISARQFFTINRSLVTSVMSALTTFLVVLVQFKDQDDEDAAKRVSGSLANTINKNVGPLNSTTATTFTFKDEGTTQASLLGNQTA